MPMLTPLRNILYAAASSSKAKKPAFGIWNTIASVPVVTTMARTPGISWIVIDAEHGQLNDTHIFTHSALISAAGGGNAVSPLVRIPVAEAWWVKRVLDSGAHGVMVPLVQNAAQVREVVSWTRYPPKGIRGFGPMYTHHTFGGTCTAEEYKNGADNVLVIVQIENKESVDNLEEIAQVDGLDVLFIGPFDLSLSLGVPFGGEAHQSAIARVLEVSHKYGKKAAIYCVDGAQAEIRAKEGFDMISVATDVDMIAKGFANQVAIASGDAGGNPVGSGYNAGN
ncbi:Phosphoenolpyruvate/pyruvate domain-containing protein [Schizopora paradoxa]|uniref:Phosphoenolpyruvate/pyruvate domain-containing protein n=1 Tax=Schizopora paradoxa TaxID=27342 RepID=A0A0H2RKK9_9AGAM|nr:Phosphoenolpyruvate/pyruvate domain-containing protein [Schizopora paradoxa]